jgi:hypothetical protein
MSLAGGPFGQSRDRCAAVDHHPPLEPVDRGDDPEMPVGRHPHMQFLARDFLVVEAEAGGDARELGLVGRLAKDDVDQEGEQADRHCDTHDPPDEGEALEQGKEQRGADRVEREGLPLREGRLHRAAMWRCGRPRPRAEPRQTVQGRNFRHPNGLGTF